MSYKLKLVPHFALRLYIRMAPRSPRCPPQILSKKQEQADDDNLLSAYKDYVL
jgi:hypothetical protein